MKMSSLIEQLQSGTIDRTLSVSDLLRCAKIVAVKLDLDEFRAWIDKELNGYGEKDEVPPYRIIMGQPEAWNPYHGWQPIIFKRTDIQHLVEKRPIGQPVGGLEEIMRGDQEATLGVSFTPEQQKKLREAIEFDTDIQLIVDRSTVAGILDAVRNVILEWSLKLEKAGIVGEGMSFSQEDKEKAHEPKTIYQINKIENFTGVMGHISDEGNVSIKQIIKQISGYNPEELCELIKQIQKYIGDIGLDSKREETLRGIIRDLKNELSKKPPDNTKIRGFLFSIKNIAENAAGNIVAKGILAHISNFI